MGNLKPKRHSTLAGSGQSDRERLAQRSRDARDAVADIGELPAVVDPKRREAARQSLRFFLREYFPYSTGLSPLCEDQLACVDRMEVAMHHESWIANIMPRGFIKSTMSENSILWALLFGWKSYILFFAGTAPLAEAGIHSIKQELLTNELLLEDFPEACVPFRALDGKSARCPTQKYKGKLTGIRATNDTLRLPYIPGFDGAGGIVESYGLLAPPRGARFKDERGRNVRPDFGVLDDPQTDDSASSYPQTQKRLHYIRNSISMMGGHGEGMSLVMNATIVAEGDLADRISNGKTEESQAWLSNRVSMLKSLPVRLQDLWLIDYAKLRREYDRSDPLGQVKAKQASTEFYRKHQAEMDRGAEASWEHIALKKDEISAIQHAMNVWIDKGEETFWAECQNQPLRPAVAAPLYLESDELCQRHSNYGWGVIPDGRGQVVFHVDAHDELFYYTVAAVGQDFSGDAIAYGTWPEQPNEWFNLRTAKNTLSKAYPGETAEKAMELGLQDLLSRLLETEWAFSDGRRLPVSCGLVDAGYKPKIVANAIRAMKCGDRVMGSRGIPTGPKNKPMPEYDLSSNRCLRAGPDPEAARWYYPTEHIDGGVLRVHFDANFWKSVLASRLSQSAEVGAWRLWGDRSVDHGHYVSHLVAERPNQETAMGRTVNVWSVVGGKDNHWWDTFVGCTVAASIMGCVLPSEDVPQVELPEVAQPNVASRLTIARKNTMPDGRPFFISRGDR